MASPYAASRLGRHWASSIGQVIADEASVAQTSEQAALGSEANSTQESEELDDFESTTEHLLFADSGKQAPKRARAVDSRRSIYVSAATVLCLAQTGTQPSGKPVAARGKRPAGVAVFGVSGLGLGVRDGDVVTEILGQPVRSVAQGITLIIMARASNRPTITGTVWRLNRPYGVTVEQPYAMPDCSPDEPDCWKSHCAKNKKAKDKPRSTGVHAFQSKSEGRRT